MQRGKPEKESLEQKIEQLCKRPRVMLLIMNDHEGMARECEKLQKKKDEKPADFTAADGALLRQYVHLYEKRCGVSPFDREKLSKRAQEIIAKEPPIEPSKDDWDL